MSCFVWSNIHRLRRQTSFLATTVRVIAEEKVTNLAAAPTAYRLLKAAGDAAMAPIKGQLRAQELIIQGLVNDNSRTRDSNSHRRNRQHSSPGMGAA